MSKSILLVDDTETVLLYEQMMLRPMGFELRIARNGALALAEVAQKAPDLILLDIMMPELNGIETCRRLKGNPESADIPIIMVTTKSEQGMIDRAVEAGCNDFITKPLDHALLKAKVRFYLG